MVGLVSMRPSAALLPGTREQPRPNYCSPSSFMHASVSAQLMTVAAADGAKIAVHCHAGLGRTGCGLHSTT